MGEGVVFWPKTVLLGVCGFDWGLGCQILCEDEGVLEAEDREPKLERDPPLSLTRLSQEEVEGVRQWLGRALVFPVTLGSTKAGDCTTPSRLVAEAACTSNFLGEAKLPATAT